MNDRYLYRAKRTDNGEWVEGDLVHSVYKINDTCVGKYGSEVGIHQVHENTICQCTGLKDKNGKLIWENDVTLRTSVTGTYKGKIFYGAEGAFCQKDFETLFENLLLNSESYFEVIGNIFDNPELLEVEK